MQVVPRESDVQEQQHQNGSHVFDDPISGVHIQMYFLANVSSRSRSLCVIAGPSVCRLSVTFVHASQAIEIFGNVFTPFGTLVIPDLSIKILRRSSQWNPFVGG